VQARQQRGRPAADGVVPDPLRQRVARDVARHEAQDLARFGVAAERRGGRGEAARADVAQERVDRVRPRAGRTADRVLDPLAAGEAGVRQPPPFPLPASCTGPRRKTGPGRDGLPFASRVTRISR
jgi:hypothetical protein